MTTQLTVNLLIKSNLPYPAGEGYRHIIASCFNPTILPQSDKKLATTSLNLTIQICVRVEENNCFSLACSTLSLRLYIKTIMGPTFKPYKNQQASIMRLGARRALHRLSLINQRHYASLSYYPSSSEPDS